MSTACLDHTAAHGTGWQPARIRLADGHMMTVQAGPGAASLPRPAGSRPGSGTVPTDYPGPYTHIEVFLWPGLHGPDEWAELEDQVDADSPDAELYLEVPVEWVRAFVLSHGGEHADQDAKWPRVRPTLREDNPVETAPALYVQPGGHTEPFNLDSEPKRQQSDIADELDGRVTAWRLGRHMTVHVGIPAYERTRNEVVRCAWRDLAGGDAPDLRGPVIVTGPPLRDGLLQPLPALSAERVDRWAGLLRSATIRRRPQMSAAQAVGTRDLQCDGHAVHHDRDSGRWAFVVLDGIGDEEEVQDHVRTWAPALARAAARLGDPADAIEHVRAQILAELRGRRRRQYMDPGAVVVVAVHHRTDPLLRLAWSGDARAYRLSHIDRIEPLTKDHNWAQELLDAGRTPEEWDHNSVTAHLEDGTIGRAEVDLDVVAQLVLCSDGVYHPLETYEPGLLEEAALLALDAKDSAASLVAEALAQGRSRAASCDNATALVVTFPRPGDTARGWRSDKLTLKPGPPIRHATNL